MQRLTDKFPLAKHVGWVVEISTTIKTKHKSKIFPYIIGDMTLISQDQERSIPLDSIETSWSCEDGELYFKTLFLTDTETYPEEENAYSFLPSDMKGSLIDLHIESDKNNLPVPTEFTLVLRDLKTNDHYECTTTNQAGKVAAATRSRDTSSK